MPRKKKPTPKTQPCTICEYPRKFVRMREKEGKDGRIARWPEYEKCPNKGNPKLHPSAKNLTAELDDMLMDPDAKVVQQVIEYQKRPSGVMYQVQDVVEPLDEIADCLLHYEDKYGELPIAIGVRKEEAEGYEAIDWELEGGKEESIPIWPMKLSPGYGYLFLVKELA